MQSEPGQIPPSEIDWEMLTERVEAHHAELVNLCEQNLRENVFTNRSLVHPRILRAHAEKTAEEFTSYLRSKGNTTSNYGGELSRQGYSLQSILGLYRIINRFIHSIFGEDQDDMRLASRFLLIFLESYIKTREKIILDEQESFRIAFQMALNDKNTEIMEARLVAQQAIESSYRDVIRAQEEERRRIARELHDEAGQILISLYMNLENMLKDPGEDDAKRQDHLVKALGLTDNAMKDIKALAYSLRPPVLDLLGINLAIKQLCRDFAEQSKVIVKYSGMEFPPIADELAISLYRVVQEGLTNIAKHSHAKHARINLKYAHDTIELSITDDGQGFDPNQRPTGMGLNGMHERIHLLNGEMKIKSVKGKSTQILIQLPLVLKPIIEDEPGQ